MRGRTTESMRNKGGRELLCMGAAAFSLSPMAQCLQCWFPVACSTQVPSMPQCLILLSVPTSWTNLLYSQHVVFPISYLCHPPPFCPLAGSPRHEGKDGHPQGTSLGSTYLAQRHMRKVTGTQRSCWPEARAILARSMPGQMTALKGVGAAITGRQRHPV